MEYKIVTVIDEHYAIEKLEEKVNEFIKMGWKPIGGVSIIKLYEYNSRRQASQAMIKD
ncbi:MAG: DUF1737 domain-containing protein [Clostridiales bacterium]|nr:DUF1737 domain-containing protein [Clostridiales bacterium]